MFGDQVCFKCKWVWTKCSKDIGVIYTLHLFNFLLQFYNILITLCNKEHIIDSRQHHAKTIKSPRPRDAHDLVWKICTFDLSFFYFSAPFSFNLPINLPIGDGEWEEFSKGCYWNMTIQWMLVEVTLQGSGWFDCEVPSEWYDQSQLH